MRLKLFISQLDKVAINHIPCLRTDWICCW